MADSPTSASGELTLADLAGQTGLSARTIRYYISEGLLPGPAKAGRGATYGEQHLRAIREIKDLQAQGLTLAEMRPRLMGDELEDVTINSVPWQAYQLSPDVVVNVRADAAPWRQKQIRRLLSELASTLNKNK